MEDSPAVATETQKPKRLVTLSMFDTKAASEAGIVVELEEIGLDDDGKPYFWTILGMDAGKVVDKDRKNLSRYLTALRKNKDAGNAEVSEKENIDKLAASTIAWHLPPIEPNDPEPVVSEQNARKILSDPRFRWIVRKLTKAQSDDSDFFVKSSTS
jgi:hypothetical protein